MASIDFDELEESLDLKVPNFYRMFIGAVESKGYKLKKYGIYSSTEDLLKANLRMRMDLKGEKPKWKKRYLDFGLGDGCGNYYFLVAKHEDDDLVKLWAHDPPGIEEVSSGADFFMRVLAELDKKFKGPDRWSFDGRGKWW